METGRDPAPGPPTTHGPHQPHEGKAVPWGCTAAVTKLRSRAESSVSGERTRVQQQVPRGDPGEGGCPQRRAGRARAAFPASARWRGPSWAQCSASCRANPAG